MNMIQKLKKNKKGFTLVELLVVLVILAILAAAVIPSMMGFIDKAKEESASAECRSALLAIDVELNEEYGLGTTLAAGTAYDATSDLVKNANTIAAFDDSDAEITSVTLKANGDHFEVSAVTFTTSNNQTYTYNGSTWTKS